MLRDRGDLGKALAARLGRQPKLRNLVALLDVEFINLSDIGELFALVARFGHDASTVADSCSDDGSLTTKDMLEKPSTISSVNIGTDAVTEDHDVSSPDSVVKMGMTLSAPDASSTKAQNVAVITSDLDVIPKNGGMCNCMTTSGANVGIPSERCAASDMGMMGISKPVVDGETGFTQGLVVDQGMAARARSYWDTFSGNVVGNIRFS